MTILSSVLRYHFWIRDFFRGGKIRSHYMNVRYLQEHGAQTQFLRQRMLTDLLRYAVKNTRFYKNINSLELKDFPVVNKQYYRGIMTKFLYRRKKTRGSVVGNIIFSEHQVRRELPLLCLLILVKGNVA